MYIFLGRAGVLCSSFQQLVSKHSYIFILQAIVWDVIKYQPCEKHCNSPQKIEFARDRVQGTGSHMDAADIQV